MAHKRATLFSSRTGKTRPDEKAWKEEKATSSEVIHYVSQCDQVADDVFTAVYGNQQKSSSVVGLVGLLQDCAKRKDLLTGSKLHTDIFDRGLHKKNIIIGNTLVHMYLRCGALSLAKQVFDELPFRTLVSWTMLIAGYAEHGHGEQALKYVDLMREEGLCLDEVSLACILKACGSIRATEEGKKVHAEIVREGLLGKQGVLGGALVDMYAKCGALSKAQGVFNELPSRNTVSWTALITGYCQHGQAEDALTCFERMKQEGVCPDRVTLSCILKACGSVGAGKKGQEIHDEIIEKGLLRNDIVLGNALLDMYAKCGAVDRAQEVFDELRGKNRVSWNSLIGGYCQHGHGEKALDCYDQMIREGLAPDGVTFACALKACGSTGAVEKGEDIHLEIIREGFLEKFCVLGSALVDMYSKCGQLVKAREVFDELPVRDLVSWTALLGGYCEHGCGEEALVSFERMMSEGRSPDAVTFACI